MAAYNYYDTKVNRREWTTRDSPAEVYGARCDPL
jgi:hypothetical protein